MLVNQILLYSVSNNTNNIRFKLCKNGFIAVNAEKKRLKREPTLPYVPLTVRKHLWYEPKILTVDLSHVIFHSRYLD